MEEPYHASVDLKTKYFFLMNATCSVIQSKVRSFLSDVYSVLHSSHSSKCSAVTAITPQPAMPGVPHSVLTAPGQSIDCPITRPCPKKSSPKVPPTP